MNGGVVCKCTESTSLPLSFSLFLMVCSVWFAVIVTVHFNAAFILCMNVLEEGGDFERENRPKLRIMNALVLFKSVIWTPIQMEIYFLRINNSNMTFRCVAQKKSGQCKMLFCFIFPVLATIAEMMRWRPHFSFFWIGHTHTNTRTQKFNENENLFVFFFDEMPNMSECWDSSQYFINWHWMGKTDVNVKNRS